MTKFSSLPDDTKDEVKDIISKMATVRNFKSPKLKLTLHGYAYGEIRPMPHRFFFFQKCGNNYIFFDYVNKKKDSFPDSLYRAIDRKREIYEQAFEEFIKRSG